MNKVLQGMEYQLRSSLFRKQYYSKVVSKCGYSNNGVAWFNLPVAPPRVIKAAITKRLGIGGV